MKRILNQSYTSMCTWCIWLCWVYRSNAWQRAAQCLTRQLGKFLFKRSKAGKIKLFTIAIVYREHCNYRTWWFKTSVSFSIYDCIQYHLKSWGCFTFLPVTKLIPLLLFLLVLVWLCDYVMQFECPHFTLVRHRVPLAQQWLEHPTRSRRVVGSNPIWCWDFFRVPFDAKNVSSSIIFNNVFNDIDCVKEKSENKQTTSI